MHSNRIDSWLTFMNQLPCKGVAPSLCLEHHLSGLPGNGHLELVHGLGRLESTSSGSVEMVLR